MGKLRVFCGVFRQPGFLTDAECLAVRQAMDRGQLEHAEVLSEGVRRETRTRLATLVEPEPQVIDAMEAKLEACRAEVSSSLGLALGAREGTGFIRYPPGGFYRPHRDRGTDPGWPDAARRQVAVVVFLNTTRDGKRPGDFDGGRLRLALPGGDLEILPEAGLLVAFQADVLHEVTEVRAGTRDTIVDWFYEVS